MLEHIPCLHFLVGFCGNTAIPSTLARPKSQSVRTCLKNNRHRTRLKFLPPSIWFSSLAHDHGPDPRPPHPLPPHLRPPPLPPVAFAGPCKRKAKPSRENVLGPIRVAEKSNIPPCNPKKGTQKTHAHTHTHQNIEFNKDNIGYEAS